MLESPGNPEMGGGSDSQLRNIKRCRTAVLDEYVLIIRVAVFNLRLCRRKVNHHIFVFERINVETSKPKMKSIGSYCSVSFIQSEEFVQLGVASST